MNEFYIETNSFAAPFFSDSGHRYVQAESPREALETVVREYKHPAGLFAALAYSSADAKNKGEMPLARWVCNHEAEKDRLTRDLVGYSFLGHSPGRFEINGEMHVIEKPKEGRVYE